jgi:alkanesulfonate monooxygenase SsuD/methylene tetrahydromethanopterin reductase-like flavin-dependent oxidoreductase (luciferase family)
MHYGVSVPNFGDYAYARVQAELAREAEEAGWDGVFLWDHIHFWTSKRVPMVDPWIALAAMAMSTTRIR